MEEGVRRRTSGFMRTVIQRVSKACVCVEGEEIARIGPGLLVLLGVSREDGPRDVQYMAEKIAGIRIFEDEQGKMNRSVQEVGGSVLVVSQFTLLGDTRKGRRPSFINAARPEQAESLYLAVAEGLRTLGLTVQTGRFQAMMQVALVNDGPVTILLDSAKEFRPNA
jgi:D-tyrosyl-tRNA(Tyr) deacylase